VEEKMDFLMAVLAVAVFAILFVMNCVAANPQELKIDDPTVPFFLTLVSALSYSFVAFAFLHVLGLGAGIKHLWLTCLPFSLILATAVFLYFAKKSKSPFGKKKRKNRFAWLFNPPQEAEAHLS
jgi:hypothetical protein